MLKKIILNLCLLVLIFASAGIISACCSKNITINIIFSEVDPEMGVSNYSETIVIGKDFSIEFEIPEGYTHSGISASIGEKQFDCDIKFEDEKIGKEDEYNYATKKTVTLTLKKIISDIDLIFDMSGVKKQRFDIEIDGGFLNSTFSNNGNVSVSNLRLITIDPNSTDSLLELNSDVILKERTIPMSKITRVDYGEHIILLYDQQSNQDAIDTVYSNIYRFTNDKNIPVNSVLEYSFYDVSKKGNVLYSYNGEHTIKGTSRLFYLGKIMNSMKLYNQIPNYVPETGFAFEDDENEFTLLTNKQDYNSDLLSINVFKPTSKVYNAQNSNLDVVEDVTVEKIEKYNGDNEINNSIQLYEYLNRYDVYSMYIGENKDTDLLLSEGEKDTLSDVLYVSVESSLKVNLGFYLLEKEKQINYINPYYELTEKLESRNGKTFFKIERSTIEKFLKPQKSLYNGNIINNEHGYAIFYVKANSSQNSFDCLALNYPVLYNGHQKLDYDYNIEFYILNEDGSKDYGFVDHQYNLLGNDVDCVYFSKRKMYKTDAEGNYLLDASYNHIYLNNLYVDIIGPDIDDFKKPSITDVTFVFNTTGSIFDGSMNGGKVYRPVAGTDENSIRGIQITDLNEKQISHFDKQLRVYIGLTNNDDVLRDLDFSNVQFHDDNSVLFITDSLDFETALDFIKLNGSDTTIDGIEFGKEQDLYYFVESANTNQALDICLKLEEDGEIHYYSIAKSKALCDIAGNPITVKYDNRLYNTFVVYQTVDICIPLEAYYAFITTNS